MSDNEDLLADDVGDQSLADYNLGNEEEEQLLADDYDGTQNVPMALREDYSQPVEIMPIEYGHRGIEYAPQPVPYQQIPETESVVPNITVEVPNISHSTYAPIEQRHYEEHTVPPAIPAMPMESPQIVPSDIAGTIPNGDANRERFISERPVGAQRMPQVRDIPDTLDKVVIPRGGYPPRGRTSWRNPHYAPRHGHPYRRNNMQRGNFGQRSSFPPPQIVRPNLPPPIRPPEIMRPDIPHHDHIRPEVRHGQIGPEIRHEPMRHDQIRPEIRHEVRPDMRHDQIRPELMRPDMLRPEIRMLPPDMDMFRPRFPFAERPNFPRPPFERPVFPYRQFGPRFPPREIVPNAVNVPQVTIRQEPEVRMLPVLPPHLPPTGLAGKKVLINPHFKGNFQPPVEGLPVYIPTRIQKSPPLSPPRETKFGPIKDIDDAAERFIAEQRNALARAASRRQRRSPQRFIENTTIEIANELASTSDDDLLRRQEEFINANRMGLRRRMRSPSPPPPRRSPSPRRRDDKPAHNDEESEYARRMREQESLRERVLRAKEVRRRKNAVAAKHTIRERENEKPQPKEEPKSMEPEVPKVKPSEKETKKSEPPATAVTEVTKADTTRTTPERRTPEIKAGESAREKRKSVESREKVRDRSPVKKDDEVNSTCEGLTPPWRGGSDDDLDLILGDIDGFLSDDDNDTGRFKDKRDKDKSPPKPAADLRSKLGPKETKPPAQRQKIVFADDDDKRDKTPPRRAIVSSTKTDEDDKKSKIKPKQELLSNKSRQRITFGNKDNKQQETEKQKEKQEKTPPFSNRRVVLQRKAAKSAKTAEPTAGIFSRAVRTVFGEKDKKKVDKTEPKVEFESDDDLDEDRLLNEDLGTTAIVSNLPHGMTDTRLRTLAGNDVQNLLLEKEDRSAKITFKTTVAAETFRKKFNNKMVAASRLTVTLR